MLFFFLIPLFFAITSTKCTYSRVQGSGRDGDDGVIVINGSWAVAWMAEEVSGEERLSWVLVLSGSENDGQGSKDCMIEYARLWFRLGLDFVKNFGPKTKTVVG